MYAYGMEEKRGIITGGTSGIGLAAAKMLVRDGAHVFIVGRDAEKGKAALTALSDGKGKATYVEADVSTLEGCQKVVEAAGEGNVKVDFLVNCAGMYQEEALQDITEASYSKMMDENVKSTIFLTKAVLSLLSDDSPSILNIASDAALEGNYGCAVYAASKGAVVAFTRSAALDLSPWVRVNCLCPGDVNTPLVKKTAGRRGLYGREHGLHLSCGTHWRTRRSGPHDLRRPFSAKWLYDRRHSFRRWGPDGKITSPAFSNNFAYP